MYNIIKDGIVIGTHDKIDYVKLQRNGIYCSCSEAEAHGVVVNNNYVCHLQGRSPLPNVDTVSVVEFSGASMLAQANAEISSLTQQNNELANLLAKYNA
jgi:hypothetical protein